MEFTPIGTIPTVMIRFDVISMSRTVTSRVWLLTKRSLSPRLVIRDVVGSKFGLLLFLPPVCDVLAAGACAAVHDLNIASIDSFVKAVSLVLIDASTRPGIDGAILLAPLAWSYWTGASLVLSSRILSVCANKTVCRIHSF